MILILLAVAAPAIGSPEWIDRATTVHQTEYPAVFKLVEAARKGDEADFRQYLADGATFSGPGQAAVPFTGATVHDLATQCAARDAVAMRFLDDGDELTIYWRCPPGSPSPMTRLLFQNGKIVHAETGPAVVHVLPALQKGAQ